MRYSHIYNSFNCYNQLESTGGFKGILERLKTPVINNLFKQLTIDIMDKVSICHQQACQQTDASATNMTHDAASTENLKYSEIELQFKVFVMQRLREKIQDVVSKIPQDDVVISSQFER